MKTIKNGRVKLFNIISCIIFIIFTLFSFGINRTPNNFKIWKFTTINTLELYKLQKCIACFRPALVSNVRLGERYRLVWSGSARPRITTLH